MKKTPKAKSKPRKPARAGTLEERLAQVELDITLISRGLSSLEARVSQAPTTEPAG